MIELIVADKYKLQLPRNVELQFVEENPFFADDNTPAPYTLSFELDATRANLEALGLLNRITSRIVRLKVPARIDYNSFCYSKGELIVLGFDKRIKLQYKGFADSMNYEVPMNKLDLDEYNFGMFPPVWINVTQNPSITAQWYYYMSALFTNYLDFYRNLYSTQSEFALGPIKKLGAEWKGTGYTKGFYNFYKNYINFCNPGDFANNPWQMFDTYYNIHNPIYPYPYVNKVFDKVFGDKLINNPFADGDLQKLCIVSLFNKFNRVANKNEIEFVEAWIGDDNDRVLREFIMPLVESYEPVPTGTSPEIAINNIKLQSFMPDYSFAKFITELLKMFGMFLSKEGNQYRIFSDNEFHNRDAVICLDKYLIDNEEINYEEQPATEYVLELGGDKTEIPNNTVGVLNTKEATDYMFDQNPPKVKNDFLDLNTNQVFTLERSVRGLTNQQWLAHETIQSALVQKENPEIEEKKIISTEVAPLEMQVEQWWQINDGGNDLIPRYHWHVPVVDLESKTKDSPPPVMLSYGLSRTVEHADARYPLITNHNVDMFGERRGEISLLPNGDDGLIKKFHNYNKKFWEGAKQNVKARFLLPFEVNKSLKITDKVNFKGKNFYIQTREYDLTNSGISPVELMLVECKV